MNKGIGFSQWKSLYQWAVTGDADAAWETQKQFLDNATNVVTGMPVIGHATGVYYCVTGEAEKGREMIFNANKSAAVVGGAILGGPAGAVGAGVAMDALQTGVKSAIQGEYAPTGNIAAVTNVVNGNTSSKSGDIFDVVASIGMDAAAGYMMQKGLSNQKTGGGGATNALAAISEVEMTQYPKPTAAATSTVPPTFTKAASPSVPTPSIPVEPLVSTAGKVVGTTLEKTPTSTGAVGTATVGKVSLVGEVEAGAGKFVETPGTPKAGGGTQTGKGTDTKSFGVKAQSTDLPGRSVFLRNGDKGDEDGDDRRNRRRPLPVPPHYTDYNDTDLELVFLYLERIMKFFDDLNDGLQLPNINELRDTINQLAEEAFQIQDWHRIGRIKGRFERFSQRRIEIIQGWSLPPTVTLEVDALFNTLLQKLRWTSDPGPDPRWAKNPREPDHDPANV